MLPPAVKTITKEQTQKALDVFTLAFVDDPVLRWVMAVGTPRDTGQMSENDPVIARFVDYVTTKYHKVANEYDANTWDLRGVEGDVKVYFEAGFAIANDTQFPNWFPGNEFRALREAMRAGR